MRPPTWALAGSTRLDLDEFGPAFASAWSRIEARFLKLECWQSYREAETNESQAAYDRGDIEAARQLLEHEAQADRPLYEDVQRRGVEYARVRLVQEPLTPYLEYELLSYRIRAEMGENIEVVRCEPALRLPDEQHFDFLLFDHHTALIHDYGTEEIGFQVGGWLSHEPEVIARLGVTAAKLRSRAVPLGEYLAQV
jgi:Family of unknown function (DUF6879)